MNDTTDQTPAELRETVRLAIAKLFGLPGAYALDMSEDRAGNKLRVIELLWKDAREVAESLEPVIAALSSDAVRLAPEPTTNQTERRPRDMYYSESTDLVYIYDFVNDHYVEWERTGDEEHALPSDAVRLATQDETRDEQLAAEREIVRALSDDNGRLAAELSKLRAENEKLRDVVAEYDRHAPACLKERQRLRAENAKQSSRVIGEVIGERVRQDERWGEQNHPFISGSTIGEADAIRAEYLTRADAWRRLCDERAGLGVPSWDAVLLEEVYEALSEEDPIKREEELIQVAAVAVSMVECSRRQRAAEGRPAGGEETDQWKWRSGQ